MAERRKPDSDTNWGKYLGMGLEVAVGVILGYLVGNWLDQRNGWSPWGVIVGTMLGIAAGMYMLIKEAIRMNKD
ncbi:MAG TPA: AtpZ/AtpI family protein [Tepidisphaeraceae bacterium]|jgi:ATP synthase protein I|nr:AtpZ/AtpI family protein [Tepidisphaeraceae bacterium]